MNRNDPATHTPANDGRSIGQEDAGNGEFSISERNQ